MLKVAGISAQVLREAIQPFIKRAVDVREASAS
jgi:hypothetical protein